MQDNNTSQIYFPHSSKSPHAEDLVNGISTVGFQWFLRFLSLGGPSQNNNKENAA
jgi:hypothetical protein